MPVVETVAHYPSSRLTLKKAADQLAASTGVEEYADLVHLARPLFPLPKRPGEKEPELYQHQWDSLRSVLRDRKDIVVTTGTGSGKTECFLLPLLARAPYAPLIYVTIAAFILYLPPIKDFDDFLTAGLWLYGGGALLALAGFVVRSRPLPIRRPA